MARQRRTSSSRHHPVIIPSSFRHHSVLYCSNVFSLHESPRCDGVGIRGAWSLLSNDPRRFGSPWLLHDEEMKTGKSTCVFADGPSLLYHVALSDVYDQSPPITHAHITGPGSVHQASPATIHARVTSFLKALLVAFEGDVHVAMDGLAPIKNIHTQVNRLRTMAQQGDGESRVFVSVLERIHFSHSPPSMGICQSSTATAVPADPTRPQGATKGK